MCHKYKIGISLLLTIILVLATVPITWASSFVPEGKVIFQQDEIKDIEKIIERAKANISDVPLDQIKAKAILTDLTTGQKIEIQPLVTSQLIRKVQLNDKTQDFFATNAVILYTNTQSGSKYDSTGGVRAYSTIYWTRSTVNGVSYIDLDSSSGGWTIIDGTLQVTNRRVRQGQYGWAVGGYYSYYQDYYPSGTTYSYTAPSSWNPVNEAGDCGSTSYCTISKKSGGGSSWQLVLSNSVKQGIY